MNFDRKPNLFEENIQLKHVSDDNDGDDLSQ